MYSIEAHMYLDPLYWQLEQLMKRDNRPSDPLSRMIDIVTGNDKELVKEDAKEASELLSEIIKYKKRFGIDATDAEEALRKLGNLI